MNAEPLCPDWLAHALALDPERAAAELFAARRARLGLAPPARPERELNARALQALAQRVWSADVSELRAELGRLTLARQPDLAEYAARLLRLIELRPQFERADRDGELAPAVVEALRDLASAPAQKHLVRSEGLLRALEDSAQRDSLQRGVRRLRREHRALYELEPLCFGRVLAFVPTRLEPRPPGNGWTVRKVIWWFLVIGIARGLSKLVFPGSSSR